jgi:pyrroline-5-carboxylate reductase
VRIGLIGAGNMARAMARGWGEPVLAADHGSGRAAALADELGGTAATPVEVAQQAEVVLLAHKPAQLEAVAADLAPHAKAIVSVLGGTSLAELRAAYPDVPVVRTMPNVPVAVGRGVVCAAAEAPAERELLDRLRPQLDRLGWVFHLPEAQMEAATALTGCGTAFVALVAEAQVDAAIRAGMPASAASALATHGLQGAADLLAARDGDTQGIRREVASPGGSTARGLAALEAHGLRAAFDAATQAVIGR